MEAEQLSGIEELDFGRESVQRLYLTSTGGINPERWERARDEVRFEDVVSELTGHREHLLHCPFHGRDRRPSFQLYPRTNDAFCFGCLDLDEPVWTPKGLVRIDDVRCGDKVLDRYGRTQIVYSKEYKQQRTIYEVETGNFRHDPLLLTGDHTCIFVRFQDAERYLPFIVRKHFRTQERISKKSRQARRFRQRVFSVPVTEGPTTEIEVGDYMLFPVIADSQRLLAPLVNDMAGHHCKGPTPRPVPLLPVTTDACCLYGLYVAEGSVNPSEEPRAVRWTFNINEPRLADFVQGSLEGIFGLESTLSLYPDKNTCEVICSSVELARSLSFWFGRGAANKTLPPQSLWWPQDMQRSLIRGYMEGDGDRATGRKAATVSKLLAYAVFAVGIQAGLPMSVGRKSEHTGKDNVFHHESWSVYIRRQERLDGFFHRIGNCNFYWSRVSSIACTKKRRTVADISVLGSESFVTKLGAVHNCPPGSQYYDSVIFVSRYMDCNKMQALQWIEKTFDLPKLPNAPLEDGDEDGTLGFWDLSEPFILKAAHDVQESGDPELAEDYIRIYFSSLALEKSAKASGDPEDAHLQAAMGLASVLGRDRVAAIAERKA